MHSIRPSFNHFSQTLALVIKKQWFARSTIDMRYGMRITFEFGSDQGVSDLCIPR